MISLWLVVALTSFALTDVAHASAPKGYEVTSITLGGVSVTTTNVTYSCTITNEWTASRHPAYYPSQPMLSPPLIVAHTRRYRLWAPGVRASEGMRLYLSTGDPDDLLFSILNTNKIIDEKVGEIQDVLSVASQTLPAIQVDQQHPYLSTMVPFNPSPDWFSGFQGFNTIDSKSKTFRNSFTIDVYPWDGGVRNGTTYTSPGFAINPSDRLTELTLQTVPATDVFLNPRRTGILPVATWECQLSTPSPY